MDPNETLNRLREWVKEVIGGNADIKIEEEDAADLFIDLDKWLTDGGFLPLDWWR